MQAQQCFLETERASRVLDAFPDRTRESRSRARRVVVKAEHLAKGADPRDVVTSLGRAAADARTLYEDLHCARGEMENRITEQPLDLFADRTGGTHTLPANPIRLDFGAFADILLCALRRPGLQETALAKAHCGTIRTVFGIRQRCVETGLEAAPECKKREHPPPVSGFRAETARHI